MFDPERLASNIKNSRTKLGITQTELAERLYVSSQAISKWESGQSVPDLSNLAALSDIFSTTVDRLIGHKPITAKVYLGIDGGTSKSEFVLVNEHGNIINRFILEGCNPKISGLDKTLSVLKCGIDRMLVARPDISGGFAGITGVMYGNHMADIKEFIERTYPLLKMKVDKDACNIVSSVPEFENCAAMICGTGFAIYVRRDGEYHRIGSWGYLLDNMCGGYGIGREVIRAALAQQDGFGPETLLSSMVCAKLGNRILESIDKIYAQDDGFIASFAHFAFDAYSKGDAVASKILDESVTQMTDILRYALDTYKCDNNVVLAGGLLRSRILDDLLQRKMGNAARFVIPELPPIYGACVKACQSYGEMKDGFFDNFKKSYESFN